MTSSNPAAWLPTTRAAQALGCSPEHLKRQRDTHGGFLEAGRHYSLGISATASICWDVCAVRAEFHRRGIKAREEQIHAENNLISVADPINEKGVD